LEYALAITVQLPLVVSMGIAPCKTIYCLLHLSYDKKQFIPWMFPLGPIQKEWCISYVDVKAITLIQPLFHISVWQN